MPKTEITIDRPCQTVWNFFTVPQNWEKWWGGTLQKVEPGWQSGATLVWANGNKSRIVSLIPRSKVLLTSTFMKNIFRFTPLEGATLVESEFEATGGASFSDGGRGARANRYSRLEKLKQCVESERTNNENEGSVLACQFCGKHLREEPEILAVKTISGSGGLVGNILKDMLADEELTLKRSCDSCGSIFCLECSKAQAASGAQCPRCGTKVV